MFSTYHWFLHEAQCPLTNNIFYPQLLVVCLFNMYVGVVPRLNLFSHSSPFPTVCDMKRAGDETTSVVKLINNSQAFLAHFP